MSNVFDFELISRQYAVIDRDVRLNIIKEKQKDIDSYVASLDKAIEDDDETKIHSILEDLYLETICDGAVQEWIKRIKQKKASLERFKILYLKMPSWGFRPYHS
jgi:hypothetical protein